MFLATLVYFAVSAGASLPPGQGKAIVQRSCGGCHALKVVTSKRASPTQWTALVNQMVSRGADLEDEEIDVVIEYLSKNFPVGKPPDTASQNSGHKQSVNVNTATAPQLSATLGLSPQESAAIVAYRTKNGNFKDWREVTKVPGVEAAKIENNKARLRF
jgi:competence protein ComEA